MDETRVFVGVIASGCVPVNHGAEYVRVCVAVIVLDHVPLFYLIVL